MNNVDYVDEGWVTLVSRRYVLTEKRPKHADAFVSEKTDVASTLNNMLLSVAATSSFILWGQPT